MERDEDRRRDEDRQRDQIGLYLYDELGETERRRFEEELERDPALAQAMDEQRRFLRGLHARRTLDVPDALIAECRHDLMRTIYREQRHLSLAGWWESLRGGLGGMRLAWQPTAALALLVVGYWGGRATDQWGAPARVEDLRVAPTNVQSASTFAVDPQGVTDIRSVQLDPSAGHVEIVFEERRVIRGDPSDPHIQRLLISTVRDSGSGVRLDSLEALRHRSDDRETQTALIQALLRDSNPGVRLKALEALAPYKEQLHVRNALVRALRTDGNPGIRVQAIDLLTEKPDRAIVGVLQELASSERNNYVRLQCERALHEMNASVDLY